MKLILENWRNYEKRMLMELDTGPAYERIDPENSTVKAYTKLYFLYRRKFIRIALHDRRDRMQEILSQMFRREDKRIFSVPRITSWFIEQIVAYLKQTKLHFFRGEHPNKDPDYGGPAWFSLNNVIGFEEFESGGWWSRQPIKKFKKTVYHELGHALDAAIYQALEKVKRISTSPEAASEASETDISSGWYSQSQYKKLLQITKKGLVLNKTKTSKHKESVIEFFATLRELHSFLERDITPLDVRLLCMSRTTPLAMASSGNMSVAVQYADHGLSPKERQEPIAREWTSLISQWITTLPESVHDDVVQAAENYTTWPEEWPALSFMAQLQHELDSGSDDTKDHPEILLALEQLERLFGDKIDLRSSHKEVQLGDAAKKVFDLVAPTGIWPSYTTARAEAEEDYIYEVTVKASNLVMNLSFYETIRMIDCTKHPNFIAEILNELL